MTSRRAFPSQPGQSIEPDTPKYRVARQFGSLGAKQFGRSCSVLNTWKSSLITPSQTILAIIFTKAPQALTKAYHNTHYFILARKYTSAITLDQAILFMDTTMQCSSYFLTPPEPCTQNCTP